MGRLREAAGLNQDDLAARCDLLGFHLSRSGVSHIETGFRGVSDLEMVLLAKALRVPLEALIPSELPAWAKDTRSPRARESDI